MDGVSDQRIFLIDPMSDFCVAMINAQGDNVPVSYPVDPITGTNKKYTYQVNPWIDFCIAMTDS